MKPDKKKDGTAEEDLVEIKTPTAGDATAAGSDHEGDQDSISEMSISDGEPDEEVEKIKNKVYQSVEEAYGDIEEVFNELENDKDFADLAELRKELRAHSSATGGVDADGKIRMPLRPSVLPKGLISPRSINRRIETSEPLKQDSSRDHHKAHNSVVVELKMAKSAKTGRSARAPERKPEPVTVKRPQSSSTLFSAVSGATKSTVRSSRASSLITTHADELLGKQMRSVNQPSYIEEIEEDGKQSEQMANLSPLVRHEDPNFATVAVKASDGRVKTFTQPQHLTSYELRLAQGTETDPMMKDFMDLDQPMSRTDELILEFNKTYAPIKMPEPVNNYTFGNKPGGDGYNSTTFRIVYKEPKWPHQVSLDKIIGKLHQVKTLILDDSELRSLRDISSLLPSLVVLSVKNCKLKSLDGTIGFPNLKLLNASDNFIPHAAQAAFLQELQELDLSGNPISNYDGFVFLRILKNLRTLKLYDTELCTHKDFSKELKKRIPCLRDIFPRSHFFPGDLQVDMSLVEEDDETITLDDEYEFSSYGCSEQDYETMAAKTSKLYNSAVNDLKSETAVSGASTFGTEPVPTKPKKRKVDPFPSGTSELMTQIATPGDLASELEDQDLQYQMTDGETLETYRKFIEEEMERESIFPNADMPGGFGDTTPQSQPPYEGGDIA